MKIGILTGGGDCPGLNAVIRAVAKKAFAYGYEVIGIRDGWRGLVEIDTVPLDIQAVSGILSRGGTILGTSRTNPFKSPDMAEKVINNIKKLGLDVLVGIGGDDTLGVASKLFKKGIKTIGIPKTIDNDLSGTDFTFGFDTAVSIVTEALDRLHTTTEAHHRAMIVEVMGRHAGWIATYGGMAGGGDMILIPEKPFETKDVKKDAFGNVMLGGIGEFLAKEVEKATGVETRHVVLGHLQRGGSPTAHDRVLATRYGVRAVELINEGKFGVMVALQGSKIVPIPLEEGVRQTKTVDMETS